MDSLLFIIVLFFLAAGIGYGIGAKTFTSANDVIAAVTKTFASLGGLVLMLLMVAQFIAYFNYSNMPQVAAVALADLLERAAVPPLLLLIGFILVIFLLTSSSPASCRSGRSSRRSSSRSSCGWASRRRPCSPPTASATHHPTSSRR